jgi:transcriptional regulator with XRE-family HTH domain
METLASRAGVSKGVLLQIEKERTNPSIATLCRLADALGVALAYLVETSESATVRVVRDGEAPRLWQGRPGSRGKLLVGSDLPNALEMWDWQLTGSDEYGGEAHAPGSREIVYVLTGTLALHVADQTFTLHHGDAAVFAADRDHHYRNPGENPLHFVMAVFQPELATPEAATSGSWVPSTQP